MSSPYDAPVQTPPDTPEATDTHSGIIIEQYQPSPPAENFLILVNADNPADAGIPQGLAYVSSYVHTLDNELLLNEDALIKLKQMFDYAAAEYGYTDFRVTEGYRSFAKQELLYNNADDKSLVALPGYSEHHTGLAVDISYEGVNIGNSEQGSWLMANAHNFGFILRYPSGKEDITGFGYEPWHYRYVGSEHASVIVDKGFVLEEYLDFLNS